MSTTTEFPKRAETLHPPEPPGPLTWIHQNLFSNWYNSLLTILSLIFIVWAGSAVIRWVFVTADWTPVVRHPLLYLVGQYPRAHLWRIAIDVVLFSLMIGLSWRIWGGLMRFFAMVQAVFLLGGMLWPAQAQAITPDVRLFLLSNLAVIFAGFLLGGLRWVTPRLVLVGWLLSLILSLILLYGLPVTELLPVVPTGLWGGLLVTLILALGGIILSFPIGVILALGRRSSLPVVKIFSIIFIEVVRGVPLIGILYLSSLILPLFVPPNVRLDRLMRALAGMTLFSAAYMAENVRGGLQAVPPGQEEAAKALGLHNYQITTLIVLPQALRLVIPPIVGQFISLFKDTTLASGIAVLEFLAVGRSILQANPEYIGRQTEVLIFIAAVFWVFSYVMSYASLRVEAALGVGQR